jgi:long-chain acyl-CoA synthetase
MQLLFNKIEKFKDKVALISPGSKSFNYSEIINLYKKITKEIDQKSVIIIITNNTCESIIGYVSFFKSNHVIILLDEKFDLKYINKIIKDFEPNYIYCSSDFRKNIKFKKEFFRYKNFVILKTKYKINKKINKKNKLLLTTSGSTQSPKFVRLSEENISNNTKIIQKYLNIKSSNIAITTMPMAYSYGLSIINSHLNTGGKIVVTNKTVFEKEFWQSFKKFNVSTISGVPQFYEQLRKLKLEKMNLSNLKYLTQAGGSLSKDNLDYFYNLCSIKKIKFIVMYGQTEASPRMAYLPWKNFLNKRQSIGKEIFGGKFELVDKKNNIITKPFETGEIIYYGKNVCLGYAYKNKDLKIGDNNNGKLFTGDLGYKDKENFYFIVGRKNRISKIFGIRVDLDEIEKELRKRGINIKFIPDNNYLKIAYKKSLNKNKVQAIKKLIYKIYGIRTGYIIFVKDKFKRESIFKEIKV